MRQIRDLEKSKMKLKIEKLIKTYRAHLENLGYSLYDLDEVVFNFKLTRAIARVRKYIDCEGEITGTSMQFSKTIFFQDDKFLEDIIAHEVCHLIVGAEYCKHKGIWLEASLKLNDKYGTNITKTKDVPNKDKVFEYLIECQQCKKTVGKNRNVGIVKTPSLYICCSCGSQKFKRIK